MARRSTASGARIAGREPALVFAFVGGRRPRRRGSGGARGPSPDEHQPVPTAGAGVADDRRIRRLTDKAPQGGPHRRVADPQPTTSSTRLRRGRRGRARPADRGDAGVPPRLADPRGATLERGRARAAGARAPPPAAGTRVAAARAAACSNAARQRRPAVGAVVLDRGPAGALVQRASPPAGAMPVSRTSRAVAEIGGRAARAQRAARGDAAAAGRRERRTCASPPPTPVPSPWTAAPAPQPTATPSSRATRNAPQRRRDVVAEQVAASRRSTASPMSPGVGGVALVEARRSRAATSSRRLAGSSNGAGSMPARSLTRRRRGCGCGAGRGAVTATSSPREVVRRRRR